MLVQTCQPLCSLRTKELNPKACTSVRLLGPCFKTGQAYSYYQQVYVKAGAHAQQAKQHPTTKSTQHKTPNTHTHQSTTVHMHMHITSPQADYHSRTMISKTQRASALSKSHCVCMHTLPIMKHESTTISFRKTQICVRSVQQVQTHLILFPKSFFILPTWYLCTISLNHLSTFACNLPPRFAFQCQGVWLNKHTPCTEGCAWQTGFSPSLTHSSNMLTYAPPLAIHCTNTIQSQRLQLSS